MFDKWIFHRLKTQNSKSTISIRIHHKTINELDSNFEGTENGCKCNAYHISSRNEENGKNEKEKKRKRMKQMTSRFSHKLTEKCIRCHGCTSAAHKFLKQYNIDTELKTEIRKTLRIFDSGSGPLWININIHMCNVHF